MIAAGAPASAAAAGVLYQGPAPTRAPAGGVEPAPWDAVEPATFDGVELATFD